MKRFLKSYARGLFVLLGIVMLIPTLSLHEDTIISSIISSLIVLFSGVVIFLIIPDKRKTLASVGAVSQVSNMDKPLAKIGALLFSICGFGSLVLYGFLASNFYLSQNENEDMFIVEIVRRGEFSAGIRGGCGNPFVEIEYKNIVKKLTFYCQDADDVKNAANLLIYVQEGLWGYEVIIDKGFVGAFDDTR